MRQHAPKRLQRFLPDKVPATVPARFAIWMTGIYGIAQGVVILRADPARFGGAGYSSLREFPAAMGSWGAVFLTLGAAALLGSATKRWWLKTAGVGGMSVALFLFGSGALAAVLQSPIAGPTGPPIYYLGGGLVALLTMYDESRKA